MSKLGDYLDDPTDAARLERQWAAIAERIGPDPRPARWRLALVLAGAAALAAPLGWWWQSHRLAPPAMEAGMRLEDGSRVALSGEARVDIEQNTRAQVALRLSGGHGDFTVTHDPGRPFVVRAGRAEIRVVGTRFSVDQDHDRVTVRVQEGVVEVRTVSGETAGDVRQLAAGEEITIDSVTPGPQAAPNPAPAEPAQTATSEVQAPPVPAPSSAQPVEDAKQLFERATEARRRGDARGAADLYQQLLARFPRDGRAGIAAFDLARLRMDSLGDTAGAIPLLERAAQGGGSLREDALARLVHAYQATGSTKACQRARAAYLASFPGGVHAAAVSASCP